MHQITRGLYFHSRSMREYFVEGVARSVYEPDKQFVVCRQMYESYLCVQTNSKNKTSIVMAEGSLWLRDIDDFQSKFVKVQGNE